MSDGHITSTKKDHITTIEFYHPAQNSMPGYLLTDLVDHINQAGADESTFVIVLKSSGDRTFCAGASLPSWLLLKILNQERLFLWDLPMSSMLSANVPKS